jgi:hypothetical protein
VETERECGVAFVEVMVGLVVGAIVVALVLMATTRPVDRAAERCRADAEAFTVAVSRFHEQTDPKQYPPDGSPETEPNLGPVVLALKAKGVMPGGDPLRYLGGTQRRPLTTDAGWLYDFESHVAIDAGCNEL